ncbi:acyl-CoA dehydrogenase family protein [Alteromonas gilva]|uniref:Acyl-CoA dehydrogenase n=1 Tax=Alteromonas gilva TaxID=2987522 RepID=A0ABT5KZG2_9ALTE|nr:acyl-CoA dehydrogenase [Alteromonas gilva]MDC8830146.1 acyl-CoA dehydrogenase [Alteromonas gilva]
MDFALNDIQQMLQDSADKFIHNKYDFETRQKHSKSELGYSEDNWQLFAELGWLALPFEEEFGGLDGNATDVMVLMTELGKGLLVEPYLSTVILAGNAIQRCGTAEQKEALIGGIVGGELKLAFAAWEAQAPTDISAITTKAAGSGSDVVLSGKKSVVLNAASADKLVIAARNDNAIGLYLVDADAEGISAHHYPTNDGGRASDLTFNNVSATRLGDSDDAEATINAVLNDAIVAVSAEAVALMDKMLKATVEYTKVRKQFDVPIAKFQVLQHNMVDMFMECEQARSMVYFAAITIGEGDAAAANKASQFLKWKIGQAARLVGQTAVQLHGGMGVTDELDVGHMFKRLTMINSLFGSMDCHLDNLVKQRQAA